MQDRHVLYLLLGICKITDMIDYTKVSDNEKVIELIKQRNEIEKQINELDENALLNYELLKLQED